MTTEELPSVETLFGMMETQISDVVRSSYGMNVLCSLPFVILDILMAGGVDERNISRIKRLLDNPEDTIPEEDRDFVSERIELVRTTLKTSKYRTINLAITMGDCIQRKKIKLE